VWKEFPSALIWLRKKFSFNRKQPSEVILKHCTGKQSVQLSMASSLTSKAKESTPPLFLSRMDQALPKPPKPMPQDTIRLKGYPPEHTRSR
jgi:hypothetical protein